MPVACREVRHDLGQIATIHQREEIDAARLAPSGPSPKLLAEPASARRIKLEEVFNDRVFFGATVTYVDADGGADEASTARGEVGWVSPIARALVKAEEDDVVELRTPNGARRIEVVRIVYEEG